ncbi:MAG: 3-oxoacyl-ACP reductase FabG [Deltaproteobacteria bacterium]|nr:3-oxoacyl-ACP reductase FabG [Deltaproteobacteria bacterium]
MSGLKAKLENRNALITGGSRGIGKAIACRFVEEGANVFLCARGERSLNETAEELRQMGGKVAIHVADISDQGSVERMVGQALVEFGGLDILVNNAGIMMARRFMDYTFEEFDRIMKVNFYGVWYVTRAVLPSMMERKRGKIVNIASTAGKWGSMNQSAYNTSKHAVVGLTRCLALEMAPFHINVNAICPAGVEGDEIDSMVEHWANELKVTKEQARKNISSRSPIGRFINPDEVAALAVYLASDESDAMTAQAISLCGGYLMV